MTAAIVISFGVRLQHRELRCRCASASITIFVIVVAEYQLVLVGDAGQGPRGADCVARSIKLLAQEVACGYFQSVTQGLEKMEMRELALWWGGARSLQ